ncbi:MAG: hypothetical protein UV61_C0033G0012 [Candidatus Gottesmanbacteria bacterium GW2011_GWB1_43_11]|uniref:MtN3 and saliva related transmembrane protein n=1 Tax=Candidatus Gottesmanbacteria bacterium GW2011_GWB1_43_11 TaxID=1618446 RepID=A0A0G1EMM3_9BACT|nr:MAG: hypothetical protein UV04_C0038G0013 [Candidatus Gottesmanbacteria bacterium GW2011_GWA2_42_16]KKS50753.1 MAG: hypothetical protein UV17_C0069G0004 [Candidatus Gottesmanbacteria bacterium GW2011_GWA1_42_26]KKS80301.1 MAG: hypothetical protein UV55_C0043G0011 [Candidatus Gottesmanbacteria bacterium GW2011_GWC1_43_10]KKS84286.1 MAG: hypothetical protein UV61_C0033G0012 [Candidatus Gottesmanbacteria bacterium GW2011_GWB1_43_11]HCM38049.1 hypothetical protein [Patescibacteria group bacteriu
METADIFAYAATLLGLVAFTPQVIMTWKTKDTRSVSLLTYGLVSATSALWLSYGILKNATPIIVANIVIGLHALALVIMKLSLRPRRG